MVVATPHADVRDILKQLGTKYKGGFAALVFEYDDSISERGFVSIPRSTFEDGRERVVFHGKWRPEVEAYLKAHA